MTILKKILADFPWEWVCERCCEALSAWSIFTLVYLFVISLSAY